MKKKKKKNSTQEPVPLPKGKKKIECKWVYTIKLKVDGNINQYKVRLVANGYTQKYGVDYQETFAPVVKLNIVRILISVAAKQDQPLHQFDLKIAFLNGDLEEEVQMELPPNVKYGSLHNQNVCKLKKSLYGLKQLSRSWFGRFTSAMKLIGLRQSNSDHTLFIKHNGEKLMALILYIDDMILTGNNPEEMERLKKYLAIKFEMKDLGQL